MVGHAQEAEAPLTAEGERQAQALADALAAAGIERIVSSPMRRALDSAAPLARRLGLAVEVDARLAERVLSGGVRVDWLDRLRESFDDLDARLQGGESSREAMVRGTAAVDDALRAYHRLNRLAVEVLEPGGILVTCSCSGHVSREDFLYMLVGVAQQSKREIQVLEMRGAASDHPVSVSCLETEYLKCFICRVV